MRVTLWIFPKLQVIPHTLLQIVELWRFSLLGSNNNGNQSVGYSCSSIQKLTHYFNIHIDLSIKFFNFYIKLSRKCFINIFHILSASSTEHINLRERPSTARRHKMANFKFLHFHPILHLIIYSTLLFPQAQFFSDFQAKSTFNDVCSKTNNNSDSATDVEERS